MGHYVEASGISKAYPTGKTTVHALDDISFDLDKNEFLSIVGPSGCGKTTLLKILAGLVPKTTGTIAVDGQPREKLPRYSLVFQFPVLLPWKNVLGNILIPIELAGSRKQDHVDDARELIRITGLQGFEHVHPWELSGGMQQRVSICRALISNPDFLLMDEPFGSLDALTRDLMNLELMNILSEEKKTVLMVTHSVQEAVFLSDKLIVMSPRPGRVLKTIKVDLPRPRTLGIRKTPEYSEYVSMLLDELTRQLTSQRA